MPALHCAPTQPLTQSGPFAPTPRATHQTAGDVSAALAAGISVGLTPMRFLPAYAAAAMTLILAREQLRHGDRLDELLQQLAEAGDHTVDLETCASLHRHCAACIKGFVSTVRLPEVKV